MEFKILFKENYYKALIIPNLDIKNGPMTIKFLIDMIIEYSNSYNPTNSYIFQCRCGKIIPHEIPLKNFKCKGDHSNLPKNENNLFLLSEIPKIKKLTSKKVDIYEQISKATNASVKLRKPQIETHNNNNNNNVRNRRNAINNLILGPNVLNYLDNHHFIPNYDLNLYNNLLEMGFEPNHIRISLRLTLNSFEEAIMMLIDSQNNFWERFNDLSGENNNLIGLNFNPLINNNNNIININNNNNNDNNNVNNNNNNHSNSYSNSINESDNE